MLTRLSLFCEKAIEAGWLLALLVVPLFFNMYSHRVFEPDKMYLLRSLVLMMIGIGMVRLIEPNSFQGRCPESEMDWSPWKRLFHFPLTLPVLLVAGGYLLSTFLSVLPRMSLWGSYSRLQGLFSNCAYWVVFFLMVTFLKRYDQVFRLRNILVLTSFPIAFYAFLQHFQSDPMSWAGERAMSVPNRVVSTMGNPIFLGAYLMMVIPVTLAGVMEPLSHHREENGKTLPRGLLACCFLVILGMQILALLFTQSRGPWLGLIAGLYAFFQLSLLAYRRGDRSLSPIRAKDVMKALSFSFLSLPAGMIPAYLVCVFLKRGRRWLWLSWVFQAMVVAGILFILNMADPFLSSIRSLPYLGRFGQLASDAGSVMVRKLIWEGAVELIQADPVRAVVGYGPETLQTVYHPYYPPSLAHYASRHSPVDRAHNETFDALVTTGWIGLGGYLFLVGSFLYYGLSWFGFIRTPLHRRFFVLSCGAWAIGGLFVPRWVDGSYRFSGIGVPFGILFGAFFYLLCLEMASPPLQSPPIERRRVWLMTGLFAGLVAHLVEVQFGIAITVTRLYFWTYLALFVVLGYKEIQELEKEDIIAQVPHVRERPRFPFLPLFQNALLMFGVLFTLGFEFVNNAMLETSVFKMIKVSLTTLGLPGQFKPSFGILWMFLLTGGMGGLLFIADQACSTGAMVGGKRGVQAFVLYLILIFSLLTIGLILQVVVIRDATDFANTFPFFWVGLLWVGLMVALFLSLGQGGAVWQGWPAARWIYPILMLMVMGLVYLICIRTIRADIYFKQGHMMREKQQWIQSLQYYRYALSLAPDQEDYYTGLANVLIQKAGLSRDDQEMVRLFEEGWKILDRARELNPLNPDHHLHLGFLYHRWAERTLHAKEKRERLQQAEENYQKASELAPRNVQILNGLAQVNLAQGRREKALERLNRSLSLDPYFGSTYFEMGEVFSLSAQFKEAEEAYWEAIRYDSRHAKAHSALGYIWFRRNELEKARDFILEALRIDPHQPTARSVMGLIYFRSGDFMKALEENLKILNILPNDVSSHKNLSLIYEKLGHIDKALLHASRAMELSSEHDRPAIRNYIEQLKGVPKTD